MFPSYLKTKVLKTLTKLIFSKRCKIEIKKTLQKIEAFLFCNNSINYSNAKVTLTLVVTSISPTANVSLDSALSVAIAIIPPL